MVVGRSGPLCYVLDGVLRIFAKREDIDEWNRGINRQLAAEVEPSKIEAVGIGR